MASAGGDALHAQAIAIKQLWSLTMREALTQTFSDVFVVLCACFVIATVMVPLMKKVVKPAGPVADAH